MASAGLSPRHGQPPNPQSHREVPSKQVSEASTQAHCRLLPRCASAPRGRANLARGAARGHGRERRAEATGAGCSCWLSARGEAAAGGPDTAPRGSSACPPARVSTAVSRRVQPSSPAARTAAGGLSQHLPAVSHTPFRDTGGLCPHTRAPTAARSLSGAEKKNKKKSKPKDAGILGEQGWRRCADSGVPLAAAGVRPPGSEAKSVSQSEEPGARGQRRQDLHPAHAPPLRPGARLCRQPFLTCRVSRAGGRERGRPADAGGEELGFGESDGRRKEEQRRCTAAEGGWSPQQSPRILR